MLVLVWCSQQRAVMCHCSFVRGRLVIPVLFFVRVLGDSNLLAQGWVSCPRLARH